MVMAYDKLLNSSTAFGEPSGGLRDGSHSWSPFVFDFISEVLGKPEAGYSWLFLHLRPEVRGPTMFFFDTWGASSAEEASRL